MRKAKVCVIRKLIKDSKDLKKKHGNEKQQEKYRRKAERMVQEVLAGKKIEDDEVTKFGLSSARKLEEILGDESTDVRTRVIARMAHHKSINDKIAEIKQKYPNLAEHLGPGKKKQQKLNKSQKKASDGAKRGEWTVTDNAAEGNEAVENDEGEVNESESECALGGNSLKIDEEDLNLEGEESDSVSHVEMEIPIKREHQAVAEKLQDCETENFVPIKKKKLARQRKSSAGDSKEDKKLETQSRSTSKPVCLVSKEVTVKRFAEILEEETTNSASADNKSSEQVSINASKFEREEDPFFMTSDGQSSYLRIAVPKHAETEVDGELDEEFDGSRNGRWQNSHRNRRFNDRADTSFSKHPRRDEGRFKQTSGNFNSRGFNGRDESKPFYSKKEQMGGFDKQSIDKSSGGKVDGKTNESLHPSWIAKKKQQDALKQGFQGKKIVFDED